MAETAPLVLVIEDESQIRRFLRATLTAHGYRLVEAESGRVGLALAARELPDLVILDLGLPDMEGLEVARQLREWTAMPILVLSARGQEQDKIEVLDAGADDYLTKPFGVAELMARMRVALRHAARAGQEAPPPVLAVDGLRIDLARRQVFVDEVEVHLSPIEWKLLAFLAQHAGKVVTQRQLLREAWGPAYLTETHYLRVYMGHLRHKLERDPARPRFIRTEPGVGYRLLVAPE